MLTRGSGHSLPKLVIITSIDQNPHSDLLILRQRMVRMAGSSSATAFVRAAGFGGLPALVERQAGERVLVHLFEDEGVPVALRDAPATPMPLRSMMSLFERGARALGSRTFGVEVGELMTHRGYGMWVEHAVAAPTLGEAIGRLVNTSWAHLSGARLELVHGRECSALRFVSPTFEVGKVQHCDHLLPPMLTFFRLYLGDRWQPEWAEVEYARDPGTSKVESRLQVAVRPGRPGTGLVFKSDQLARKRNAAPSGRARTVTLRDVLADMLLHDAPEPARAISAVVALRLLDGQSDIEGAGRLVGLSVQSLQRRLRERGYTYREIVEEARCARAIRLLLETRMTVLSIALSLGYETHGSFTRAFMRWTGCTPTDYRRAAKAGSAG